jgi:hypothetical protein
MWILHGFVDILGGRFELIGSTLIDLVFVNLLFFEDGGQPECGYIEKMPHYFAGDVYGFVESELFGFSGPGEFERSREKGRSKSTGCISRVDDDLTKLNCFLRRNTGVQRNEPGRRIGLPGLANLLRMTHHLRIELRTL